MKLNADDITRFSPPIEIAQIFEAKKFREKLS